MLAGYLNNVFSQWELSGGNATLSNGHQTYKLGTVSLSTLAVAVITADFSNILYNMTYGLRSKN